MTTLMADSATCSRGARDRQLNPRCGMGHGQEHSSGLCFNRASLCMLSSLAALGSLTAMPCGPRRLHRQQAATHHQRPGRLWAGRACQRPVAQHCLQLGFSIVRRMGMPCLLGTPPQRHHLHHAAARIWQMQRQQAGRDRSAGAKQQMVSRRVQRSGGERTWACSLAARHPAPAPDAPTAAWPRKMVGLRQLILE